MDFKFKSRIQRRLYHSSEMNSVSTSSLPLTETSLEYFQDSFPGTEGLGRLDMPMATTVTKRNQVSPCSMVLSMMYAKRLRQRSKQYLESMSSSDVFFISVMMASKYLYDEGVDEEVYNDEWAASIGHDVEDVNQLEMDFLKEMDWQLFVKPEEFDSALTAVERRLALKEGVKRGWFSYTEMAVLLDWDSVYKLWSQVGLDCTKMVSLFSAVYVASLVSMLGSAAIAIQLSGPMASITVALLSIHTSTERVPSPLQAPCHPSVEMEVTSPLPMSGDFKDIEMDIMELNGSRHDGKVENISKNITPIDKDKADGRHDNVEGKKFKPGSVLSIWLFDSLLSHLWSVFGQHKKSISSFDISNPQQEFRFQGTTTKCENQNRKRNDDSPWCRCKRNRSREFSSKLQACSRFGPVNLKSLASDSVSCMDTLDGDGRNPRLNDYLDSVQSGNDLGVKYSMDWHLATSDHHRQQSQDKMCLPTLECLDCPRVLGDVFCHCSCSGNDNGLDSVNTVQPHNHHNKCHNNEGGLTHGHVPGQEDQSLDLILPMSLWTPLPILEPVGFFTKNT